jgi:hypothetical protein
MIFFAFAILQVPKYSIDDDDNYNNNKNLGKVSKPKIWKQFTSWTSNLKSKKQFVFFPLPFHVF